MKIIRQFNCGSILFDAQDCNIFVTNEKIPTVPEHRRINPVVYLDAKATKAYMPKVLVGEPSYIPSIKDVEVVCKDLAGDSFYLWDMNPINIGFNEQLGLWVVINPLVVLQSKD